MLTFVRASRDPKGKDQLWVAKGLGRGFCLQGFKPLQAQTALSLILKNRFSAQNDMLRGPKID